jgi:hypothetical protein
MRSLDDIDSDINKAIEDGNLGSYSDLLDEKILLRKARDKERLAGTVGINNVNLRRNLLWAVALGCLPCPWHLVDGCNLPWTPKCQRSFWAEASSRMACVGCVGLVKVSCQSLVLAAAVRRWVLLPTWLGKTLS